MKDFNKKISKSGSITLPAALRRNYGLADGERFNISVDSEDGTIYLQRTEGSCMFCSTGNELIVFHGRFICTSCVEAMDAQVSDARLAGALQGGVVK